MSVYGTAPTSNIAAIQREVNRLTAEITISDEAPYQVVRADDSNEPLIMSYRTGVYQGLYDDASRNLAETFRGLRERMRTDAFMATPDRIIVNPRTYSMLTNTVGVVADNHVADGMAYAVNTAALGGRHQSATVTASVICPLCVQMVHYMAGARAVTCGCGAKFEVGDADV